MPASKAAKNLSTLFLSALKRVRPAPKPSSLTPPPPVVSPPPVAVEDRTLKHFITSVDSTSSPPSSIPISKSSRKSKTPIASPTLNPDYGASFPISEMKTDLTSDNPETEEHLSQDICSILCVDHPVSPSPDPGSTQNEKLLDNAVEIPWFSTLVQHISARRKEMCRDRKAKWIFKNTQYHRFDRLVKMCAQTLGAEATIGVFDKLGRESGVKEYNALIGICVDKARSCDDEDVALEQISKAFRLFNFMKEQGFQLKEETYGPLLIYLTDMGMIEEFHFFCKAISTGNPSSLPRLGYYEMLLWIGVNNEEKIQELCSRSADDFDEGDYFSFRENYLLALCESGEKNHILQFLETVDITKISSSGLVASIFKSLGRLLLESFAEKYLLAFKTSDHGAENVSNVIYNYTTSIPNLAVEDIVLTFKDMHAKLEITPSSASYEKLITYSCDLLKVHVALDIVDQMCTAGLMPSIDTVNSILHASDESFEFNLVRRIYSIINHHKLKPNVETFRSMISLSVKMKDFDSAYSMLNDVKKMNLSPTVNMYNAIMAGYFRKKDIDGALMVLKQMEKAEVKPDSQTYSYLIHNCNSEDEIIKYYEEMKLSGIQITKHVFMALINAYASCGEFEKAKQVALAKDIPVKSLSEIKGALVSALASHGQMLDALNIYEELKQAGCSVEPKAVIALIEHLHSEKELIRLIRILEELHDPVYWVDGCCRLILHSVRYKHLSSAIDLIKQLKDAMNNDELATEVVFDQIFSYIAEAEPSTLQFGMDLLRVIKDGLGLSPPRKCLDFLLSACVNAKDLQNARIIWKEYQTAGLPYNVVTYLRMYQALLACGSSTSAKKMLSKIPQDDPDVRCVIKACNATYIMSAPAQGKKKKKKTTPATTTTND